MTMVRRKVAGFLSIAALLVVSMFAGVTPANAVNACSSYLDYETPYCLFYGSEAAATPTVLNTCDDGFGYKGIDQLQSLTFYGVTGNGQVTRGANVRFNARLTQNCLAWNGAYRVSVILIDESGNTYASEDPKGSFAYTSKLSAPVLSYCSTRTCGIQDFDGFVSLPSTAPEGIYRVRVRITADSVISPANQVLNMIGFLSTYPQARYFPSISGLVADTPADGQVICAFGDFSKSAVDTFAITGTDWEIYEDGNLIDSVTDFPVATSDNLKISQLKHGYIMSGFLNSTSTSRTYSYAVANQKRGSKYECKVAIHTKYGSGPSKSAIAYAPISTSGLQPIPNPSPTATPTTSPKPQETVKPVAATATYCKKGKTVKTIKTANAKCPSGYKKVKTANG
jgi:hypothetical protein